MCVLCRNDRYSSSNTGFIFIQKMGPMQRVEIHSQDATSRFIVEINLPSLLWHLTTIKIVLWPFPLVPFQVSCQLFD